MPVSRYQPLVHRTALVTACAALLPITVGALVTTLHAGMAFLDWPTSDGRNMLLYPWLADLRAGRLDRFAEHGHRLAGMFIGVCSIALAVVAWRREDRRWARWLATLCLLAVMVQGRLGGDRVLRNDPRWAMAHGAFASVVFTLLGATALVTSRGWRDAEAAAKGQPGGPPVDVVPEWSRPFLFAAPGVIVLQYLAGGFLRHLGTALHEHLAGAAVTAGVGLAAALAARRSPVRQVRRLGTMLGMFLALQLLLGAGAWVTRFGFPPLGYVATWQSPPQVVSRTAHAVTGMLVLMSSVLLVVRVLAAESAARRTAPKEAPQETPEALLPAALSARGGA